MTPTWLLVIQGADPSPTIATAGVATEDPDAHLIVFTEVGGRRHAVLLVHWSEDERDRLLAAVEPVAEWVFVNRVEDVTPDR